MTSAISVMSGEIVSIIYRTPMMVAVEVMSCVTLWLRLCPRVSTSLVMRESTSPTVFFSKYLSGIRLIFSEISRRIR